MRGWRQLLCALVGLQVAMPLQAQCGDSGVYLQILGSGGPRGSAGRASSAYLLWVDGTSQVLIDAGGGSKDRFYAAGAKLAELQLVALSHLHPDHAAELPAILWPDGITAVLAGPDGSDVYPPLNEFADQLFGPAGAFAALAAVTNFTAVTLATDTNQVHPVWNNQRLVVSARRVPHGNVPTLGYRVDTGSSSIVFASDQNGSDTGFIDYIRGVDSLVIHLQVAENVTGIGAQLHATPTVWGKMAQEAGVKRVIVSHIGADTDEILQQNLAVLADQFSGEVVVGEDLLCVELI